MYFNMYKEKYIKYDAQSLMAHVVEECGEVLQAIGKSMRFGLNGANPELPADLQETNRAFIQREMADLVLAMHRLSDVIDKPEAK